MTVLENVERFVRDVVDPSVDEWDRSDDLPDDVLASSCATAARRSVRGTRAKYTY